MGTSYVFGESSLSTNTSKHSENIPSNGARTLGMHIITFALRVRLRKNLDRLWRLSFAPEMRATA